MTPVRAFVCFLGVILLGIAAASTCAVVRGTSAARDSTRVIRVPLPECDVVPDRTADGSCSFSGTGTQQIRKPGEPSIPCKAVTVLLPPDADPSTVTARIAGSRWTSIEGEWDITPVPPLVSGDCESSAVPATDQSLSNGKDCGIYEKDALFPAEPICRADVQVMRQWKMVQIMYSPYAYNPVEKSVFRLSGDSIEVRFDRSRLESGSTITDASGADQVRGMAVNFAEVAGEYGGYAASADTGRYVIITTSAIEAASSSLAGFVDSKEARGFTVQVVTEDDWGGGIGDAAAEHIRSWLKSNYITLNVKYVLLIGNPDPDSGDVPMKKCYPLDETAQTSYDVPTDFYYAELTSNDWDKDGDDRYGEYLDDFGDGFFYGNPPRAGEVAVGRIPYYGSITSLDHILTKIVAYEAMPETDISWRRNVLLPMKPSDPSTPGYQLGEEIKNSILDPNGWGSHRVYDESYGLADPPETTPCTVLNVTNAWKSSDFGGVFWWTHGSPTSASYVMDASHAATLDDAHPSFTFQASCLNGDPYASGNLGYSLLKNGCVSTASSSQVSWYEEGQTSFSGSATNSGMAFEYAERLIADEMYAGDALNGVKAAMAPGYEEFWMNYLDFNLYGCPALGILTPPLAETRYATNITTSSARFNAQLLSMGTAATVTASFEWGTTSGGPYPNVTDNQTLTATGTFFANITDLAPGVTYYYRTRTTGWGTSRSLQRSLTTLTAPPSVTTDNASNLTVSSARLNGYLSSLGTASDVSVSFQWGASPGVLTYETGSQTLNGTGAFSGSVTGLTPGATYYFRAKADGHGSPVYGIEKSFTALTVPPSVSTLDADNVGISSARLRGYLSSRGTADNVTVSFQWGIAPGEYDFETTPEVRVNAGAFYFDLNGLASVTTLYYRAKAVAGEVTVFGTEKAFTTTSATPVVATSAASQVTTSSATLNGILVSKGMAESVAVSFQWGTATASYDQETPPEVMHSAGAFDFGLSGLASHTTVYYRARAVADGAPTYGAEQSFTILGPPLIASVSPATANSGQSVVVTMQGSDLSGASAVSFGPGIAVDSLRVVNDTTLSVTIRTLCNVDLGNRDVSVTTPAGTAVVPDAFAIAAQPPDQPMNVTPADGADAVTLNPTLMSSVFSHRCEARSHVASQWQVTAAPGDYSSPLFDNVTVPAHLASVTLPRGTLGDHDRYWWRVRYQDDRGAWSDWSTETSFACPDFVRASLEGFGEISVLDSASRVTGSTGGQTQEGIPDSSYFDGMVTVVSPVDSYRYDVLGTGTGTYGLTLTRHVGDQRLAVQATGIPVSAGERHQYEVDWDAVSRGEPGVTIRVDANGDGAFESSALLTANIDGEAPVFAGGRDGTPVWVWILVGLCLAAAIAGLLAVSFRAGRRHATRTANA